MYPEYELRTELSGMHAAEHWATEAEYGYLLHLLVKANNIQTVLQIGAFKHHTTYWLAKTGAKITTVDSMKYEGAVAIKESFEEFTGVSKYVLTRIAQEIEDGKREKFGLIYVDGDHKYNEALADMALSDKVLKHGGYMAIHDVATIHDVHSAWQTFKTAAGEDYKWLYYPGGKGLSLGYKVG